MGRFWGFAPLPASREKGVFWGLSPFTRFAGKKGFYIFGTSVFIVFNRRPFPEPPPPLCAADCLPPPTFLATTSITSETESDDDEEDVISTSLTPPPETDLPLPASTSLKLKSRLYKRNTRGADTMNPAKKSLKKVPKLLLSSLLLAKNLSLRKSNIHKKTPTIAPNTSGFLIK